MAKGQPSKKTQKGIKNPDRRCGKAWKKNPKSNVRPRTPERNFKHVMLELTRARKNDAGIMAAEARLQDLLRRDELGKSNSKNGKPEVPVGELYKRLEMALPQWYKRELRVKLLRLERGIPA